MPGLKMAHSELSGNSWAKLANIESSSDDVELPLPKLVLVV